MASCMPAEKFGRERRPIEAWSPLGMKTFELRMQRHCENSMKVAQTPRKKHLAGTTGLFPGFGESPPGPIHWSGKQMIDFAGGFRLH